MVIDSIVGKKGQLQGLAKITRDVTEREGAQHKLNVARETLCQSQKMEAIRLAGEQAHDFNKTIIGKQRPMRIAPCGAR